MHIISDEQKGNKRQIESLWKQKAQAVTNRKIKVK